jgi:imidazolonepropionase-like amidohydrolase
MKTADHDERMLGWSRDAAHSKLALGLCAAGALLLVALLIGCRQREVPAGTLSPATNPTASPKAIATQGAAQVSQQTPTIPGADLVITNGTIINGTGADPIHDGVVIVVGDRIVAVGPASGISIPLEARVIDAQEGTILPGFINAHVHQGYDGSNLEGWAQGGVTTVRDMGSSRFRQAQFAVRDERRAEPKYARLVAVGPFVSVPGGYPEVPWGAQALTVTSPSDARQKTAQLIDDGAQVIKIMMESGRTFGRSIPVLSDEEASAIVDVAHSRGIPVTAHAMDLSDLIRSIEAGADDIAHMIWDKLTDSVIARMVEQDTYWVPTLELYRYVSADARNGWDQSAIDNLTRFVAAGGKVALGTDFAGYDADFELGMPMVEIEAMYEAGMSPMHIIVAATQNAAHVCNLEDDIGTLEAGKYADILIVDGDPLTDMQALGRIQWVIHDGIVIREP